MATQEHTEIPPCRRASKKLPPGPAKQIFFGNLLQMKGKAATTWTTWSKSFGTMYTISLGPMGPAVVLSGANEVAKAYEPGSENDNNFRDRWRPPVLEKIGFAGSIGWENWLEGAKERKQLLHEVLSCIDMEGLLKREVEAVCDVLCTHEKDHINVCDLLNQANNNILLMITIRRGERFEYADEEFKKLSEVIETNNKHKLKGSPANAIQCLWHTPLFNAMLRDHDRVQTALQPYIDSHRENFERDNIRDLIDGYLGGVGETSFDVKEVINNVNHLFPSLRSLSSAMQWTVLFVIRDDDVQRKIHDEIDKVLVDNDDVTEDIVIKKMPYMNAVIKESLRLASPMVQTLPHCPVKDTNFMGYKIKKNMIMFSNLWGIHHDSESWPEPYLFKPDRWLDKENPHGFIPFGLGLRKCTGDKLSLTALRIFVVTIFRKFDLRGVEGEKLPYLEDSSIWTDTILPNHFNVIATSRESTEV